MADRLNGRAAASTEATVSGEDWYGRDLSGMVAERIAYLRVDMSETTSTSGAVFNECAFRDVDFNAAIHVGTAFLNCTFTGCSFFGASFSECKLLGSMFDRCRFGTITVSGGDWSFVGLPGADLGKSSFDGVRLREADLTGVRARGGSVRHCDLSSALLHKADLQRCDLRGSDLSAVDPWHVELSRAVITWEQAAVLAAALGLDVRPE